jgi:hypothetical protein
MLDMLVDIVLRWWSAYARLAEPNEGRQTRIPSPPCGGHCSILDDPTPSNRVGGESAGASHVVPRRSPTITDHESVWIIARQMFSC